MRPSILSLIVAVGCAGSSRPGVIPTMTQMPAETEKRDHLLDSSVARPTAESRKKLTSKERKAETAAATAAAVVGWLMSSNENTILGVSTSFDENRIVEQHQARPQPVDSPVAPIDKPAVLIPWVDLGKKP
jgi:hypothetical protein